MPSLCCRVEKLPSSSSSFVFVENVHYCSCSWLSHDFVPHRGGSAAAGPQCSSWAQCRAGAALQALPCAPRGALRTLCVSAQAALCFMGTCLQYHSEQLTALCFNENVASWANLLAYSQMEIHSNQKNSNMYLRKGWNLKFASNQETEICTSNCSRQ